MSDTSNEKTTKNPRSSSHNFERRLAAYGSMSLALAAVSVPRAQAAAITFHTDLTTGIGSGGAIYFDPATGYAGSISSSDDFELLTSVFASDSQSPISRAFLEVSPGNTSGNGNTFAASAIGSTGFSSVARLTPGALVGPGLTFSSVGAHLAGNSYFALGHWNPVPNTGDVGLRMIRGTDTFYGWADITVNDDYTITLHSFGYDDAGDAVVADPPETPEPASIILLALGAAGIAAWRRRTAIDLAR